MGLATPSSRGCHVYAILINVPTVDDDVTHVDPDPELDPHFLRDLRIPADHATLDLDRAAQRIHHARKLHQHAVARGLHDESAVFVDLGIDQVVPMRLQPGKRAFFVSTIRRL
jgi:hypothetical protein